MSDESTTDTLETVREAFSAWYQVPAVALVFAFMVWVRQRSWEQFTVGGEVYLSGNDAWYHFRQIEYTIEHWPSVMPYDVWTGFAVGKDSGQFGTLFDQVIATVAIVLGLGSPSSELVRTVTAFAPVVIGSLVVVPTYLIARRLGGRNTGILAAVVLSLLSGTFLSRSLVGSADHNIAEPLMMSFGVLALMATIAVAEREKPVWEQLRGLDLAPLRPVLGYSTLGGVAVALYMYVWPPGILLVGIFGVFVLVKMTSDYLDDVSPEHLGIGAGIAMTVTGLLMAARMVSFTFSATGFTLLQVLVPLGVAAGAAYVSVLARQFERRDVAEEFFPPAILGSVAAAVAVVGLVLPGVLSMIVSNLLRFVGFNATAEARTIGEAQPFPLYIAQASGLSQMEVLYMEYGFAFFLAIAMIALLLLVPLFRSRDTRKIALGVATPAITGLVLLYQPILHFVGDVFAVDGSIVGIVLVGGLLTAVAVYGSYEGERLFLVTWTIFVVAAAFTQVRFNYYLAVPVAILSAYLPFYLLDSVGYSITLDSFTDPDWNAYLTVGVVLLLLVVPLAYGVSLVPPADTEETNPPWEVGNSAGPGAVTVWDDTLTWMAKNTPKEGNWGGANNASKLDYYGTYEQTEDYNYPRGAYGVMSWWDYGHWITVL
ncbi:MAG: oligosaccharyl transferase, archaeosortase A system-associated, partial [Halanaeroarchaeum sp.]